MKGRRAILIHVIVVLNFQSRENISHKCSIVGIWLEIIDANPKILPSTPKPVIHACAKPDIQSGEVLHPLMLITANPNNIAIVVTVNHDEIITLRILSALDPVV